MIRWLINKLTLRQVFELEQKVVQLSMKHDEVLENFRRLRAYVGYHGAKKSPEQKQAVKKVIPMNPEVLAFLSQLNPEERVEAESLLLGVTPKDDGLGSDSEGGFEDSTESPETDS